MVKTSDDQDVGTGRINFERAARAAPVVALIVVLAFGSRAGAQEAAAVLQRGDDTPIDMDRPVDMSREQWRARIEEARRRSRQVAIEQRARMRYEPPSREELERIASERVLTDDSLQPGDIVATNRGLFVFRGRPDRERRDDDFVALPQR